MTPLLMRRSVLAAKVEDDPGVAETLTASEAVFNIFEPKINPSIEFERREGQGGFSKLPAIGGARGGSVTFKTELAGSGSALDPNPAWADVLLPACGIVEGSGSTEFVWAPESKDPAAIGASTKTLTIGLYIDGKLKVLRGCMGNAVFTFESGKAVMIEWTFTGIWVAPSDVALLAPTYPTTIPPRFASATLTIGSWEPVLSELKIDLGNEVKLREDATDSSGYFCAAIVDRNITGTANPEASLIAADDPHADWLLGTEAALICDLGVGDDGNSIDFDAPKLQFINIQGGDRDGIEIDEIEFALNRSASAGDDELTITFN